MHPDFRFFMRMFVLLILDDKIYGWLLVDAEHLSRRFEIIIEKLFDFDERTQVHFSTE